MVMQILLLIPWIIVTFYLLIVIFKDNIQKEAIEQEESDGHIHRLKVAMVEGKAYWVFENTFYQTDIGEDGEPMFDDAKPIDIMLLTNLEVSKLFYILDKLKEN